MLTNRISAISWDFLPSAKSFKISLSRLVRASVSGRVRDRSNMIVERRGDKYLSPLLSTIMFDLSLTRPETEALTRREREILKLLAEGKKSQEIADILFVSIHTVRTHRNNIMKKLNLKGVADLIRY